MRNAITSTMSLYGMTVKRFLLWVSLPLLVVIGPLSEASLQVSPTQLFVAAERNATGITLINTGNAYLYAQVRVYEWQQENGKEKLLPTHAIIASPPVVELAPGVNQLVRFVRNSMPPTALEGSFRIIIDELPVNVDEKNKTVTPQANGLQFRLRYSVPVFLEPPKKITLKPILDTQLIKENGAHFLRITNAGNSHAHIADLTWVQNQQRTTIASGLAGYVLPGQQRQWRLPEDINLINNSEFTARINGELLERILVTISATH